MTTVFGVLVTIAILVLAVFTAVLFERYRGLQAEVRQLRSEVHAKKARVASARTTFRSPGVDARGRTTRRDSDDLPLTGRMSTGVHLVRTDDSKRDDRELQ